MKNAERIQTESPVVLSTGGRPFTRQDFERYSLWMQARSNVLTPKLITQQDVERYVLAPKRDINRLKCIAGRNAAKGKNRTMEDLRALQCALLDAFKK